LQSCVRARDHARQLLCTSHRALHRPDCSLNEPGLYDYMIINDDLDVAAGRLQAVADRALAGLPAEPGQVPASVTIEDVSGGAGGGANGVRSSNGNAAGVEAAAAGGGGGRGAAEASVLGAAVATTAVAAGAPAAASSGPVVADCFC
jgi:hypothetical protein